MAKEYDLKFAKLLKAQQSQQAGKEIENEAILDILSQVKQDIIDIQDQTSYNVMIKFDKRLRRLEKIIERLCDELRKE